MPKGKPPVKKGDDKPVSGLKKAAPKKAPSAPSSKDQVVPGPATSVTDPTPVVKKRFDRSMNPVLGLINALKAGQIQGLSQRVADVGQQTLGG